MNNSGSAPPGAENDPRAPWNEPEMKWYEAFNEEQEPKCYGCESKDVEYYEKVEAGKYYFYCAKCVWEAWMYSPYIMFYKFLEDSNLVSIK